MLRTTLTRLLPIVCLLFTTLSATARDNQCSAQKLAHIPEDDVLTDFAKQAAVGSYQWHHNLIDKELASLQGCFSATGWQSFNQALSQSLTLKTIKDKSLVSQPNVHGDILIKTVEKDKEWLVTVPLNVHFENDSEELTEKLLVSLAITFNQQQLGVEQVTAKLDDITDAG